MGDKMIVIKELIEKLYINCHKMKLDQIESELKTIHILVAEKYYKEELANVRNKD